MRKQFILFCGLATPLLLLLSGCGGGTAAEKHQPSSPQLEARIDRSVPPIQVDVEQAIGKPQELTLSQFGSTIEYYIVGDARFPVTQAIAVPDSNALITLNNPRIYYRKPGKPSKRYGYKVLDYKWNNEMNGTPMFYDKKTTRLYVALSGKDKITREKNLTPVPCIGVLPPLDTMTTITNYYYPENTPVKYSFDLGYNRLLGFSSEGYTLVHYADTTDLPGSIFTFNLAGDTLCKIQLRDNKRLNVQTTTGDSLAVEGLPAFQTYYWNTAQDKMNFMIPFCDTVYQLRDPQTVAPLYALNFGTRAIDPAALSGSGIPDGKMWLKTLYENPKGLFLGIFNKSEGIYPIANWIGWIDEFKPTRTHQVVYLKDEGKTYQVKGKGLVNDLDDGLPFWPDGQTDDCLYMLRTVTEMRETVKRTGSTRQKELIKLLEDPNIKERDFFLIVVR